MTAIKPRIVIVGGGLAGLMTAVRAAEAGAAVDVVSLVPFRRSHSVCAQGGINAALDTHGEGDSPWHHFSETIIGGDYLADQPPVLAMCEAGPELIYLMDRMGVPFNRTPEGRLDVQKRGGGTRFRRGVYAGATTGQQLLYALDEQARRLQAEGLVRALEGWDFLSLVRNGWGRCRGITAMNLRDGTVHAFPADAVVLATGGCGALYARTTTSQICNGSAVSACYQQGATIGNGEFIQWHPTGIPGVDKGRLMSESLRGGGARLWTYRDGKPWYFLEEWYPAFGNMVPRDVASRAIYKVVREMKLGVDGQDYVHLDVRHMDAKVLRREYGAILEMYQKFMGEDPTTVPMKVFPAVHYSMAGIWVDYEQATDIPGLFAVGECEHQYHGANRLGANALLACLYAGTVAGRTAPAYAQGVEGAGEDWQRLADAEVRRQEELNAALRSSRGQENPYVLHHELTALMDEKVGLARHNAAIQEADATLLELKDRYRKVDLNGENPWGPQAVSFARQLWNMLELALVICRGALRRDESRGAHYKPDFPQRDDAHWLKTTRATWTADGPTFRYDPVDTSLLPPGPRRYDKPTPLLARPAAR
jgi:succinate dehydrogenase / fumarate reductase flavoprotein subunit